MTGRVNMRTGDLVPGDSRARRTIGSHELIPDGLACRLAAHYAKSVQDNLARFYWTGWVGHDGEPIRKAYLQRQYQLDSRDRHDPQAIAAELRALAGYFDHHHARRQERYLPETPETWLPRSAQWIADFNNLIVPWAWRPAT